MPCCQVSMAHTAPHVQADLFTKAVMLGNGVMAIASGLVGSWLVQGLGLGPVAPFDAAILVRPRLCDVLHDRKGQHASAMHARECCALACC